MSVSYTLQSCLADMRPSEAEVTRRLLRNLGLVAEKSLRDVAAVCRTSDATVVRTCRAAGFDGFQDLKYHVLRELTGGGELKPVLNGENHYGSDIAASVSAADSALEDAARLLSGASRVALAGVGASHGIALVLTDVLFTMRKQALPVHDTQMASFAFTPPVTGLLLIAISHSGETQFPLRAVLEAKKAGVKSIGLTNEPGSELARAVDVLLPTQTVERPAGSFAIAPRICQLAVLDRLLTRVRALGLEQKRTKSTKKGNRRAASANPNGIRFSSSD
jgi:DNA-binding MurR/RpiR family transcriptional regulator